MEKCKGKIQKLPNVFVWLLLSLSLFSFAKRIQKQRPQRLSKVVNVWGIFAFSPSSTESFWEIVSVELESFSSNEGLKWITEYKIRICICIGTNMIECNLVLISTSKFSKTTANQMCIISSGILLYTKH